MLIKFSKSNFLMRNFVVSFSTFFLLSFINMLKSSAIRIAFPKKKFPNRDVFIMQRPSTRELASASFRTIFFQLELNPDRKVCL